MNADSGRSFTMENHPAGTLTVDQVAENLSAFAIDRADIKSLLGAIPQGHPIDLTRLEYELAILKILSVGWGLAFFIPATDTNKTPLTQTFWEQIRQIANSVSTLTETTTGTRIDYFGILKERLDTFVQQMQKHQAQKVNPTNVMGPVFANACGTPDDPVVILAGTKMFALTLGSVKEYLAAVKIKDITIH
ncbi:MAG: hypothetical protein AB7U36_20650 [Desulfobacter sp.]